MERALCLLEPVLLCTAQKMYLHSRSRSLTEQCASVHSLQHISPASFFSLPGSFGHFLLFPFSSILDAPCESANQGPWTFLSWPNEPDESTDVRVPGQLELPWPQWHWLLFFFFLISFQTTGQVTKMVTLKKKKALGKGRECGGSHGFILNGRTFSKRHGIRPRKIMGSEVLD